MVSELEAELVHWTTPFIFDGMDASKILEGIQGATSMKKDTDVEGTSTEKILEKAGTSAAKSVVLEGMLVDAQGDWLDTMSKLFSGKGPRIHHHTVRVPQEFIQPPTPPGSSGESMSGSQRSDETMRSDPNDSDFDPNNDVSDFDPDNEV
ncbi:unnamed protein product [Urochloa humidicola]